MTFLAPKPPGINRRKLLSASAVASSGLISILAPAPSAASALVYQDFWLTPREIWLYRSSTGEAGRYEYWRDGRVQPEAWSALCVLLRDLSADIGLQIDPGVIDIVWGVQEWIYKDSGKKRLFRATDGARTEQTNRKILGASPLSTHKEGRAIDGRFEGVELARYARAARSFASGGVGLYSAHVHVDTGKLRKWGF